MNRTMPGCTIIPVLAYEDVDKAIGWLCRYFGFTERWRAGGHRAQLSFEGAAIILSELPQKNKTDHADGMPRHSIMVRVKDVNAHYENARRSDASILQEPTDFPYGERQYTVLDPGGHIWTFSQSIADLAPEDWGGTSAKGFK